MPTTVVTAPNGTRYRVTHPEGATQEEIQSRVQQYTVSEEPERALPAFTHGMSRGLLQTLDIPTQGLAGLWNIATGQGLQLTPFQTLGGKLGLGTYQPQTPTERKAAFAGEIVGAGALPGGAAVRASALPTRALAGELAATAGAIGGGLAGEAMGGEAGRTLGTLAGGIAAPMATPTMAGRAARFVAAPRGQKAMGPTVEAARRQQVPITLGQAARGSYLEKVASTLPGAKQTADKFVDMQRQAMEMRLDDITRGLAAGEKTSEAAGRAIQRGLEDWTAGFKDTAHNLDTAVAQYVDPRTPTRLAESADTLDKLIPDEEFSKILDPPLVRQLNQLVGQKTEAPFEVVRAVRSAVGDKLSTPALIADIPKGKLKQLYGALSRDMEVVVGEAGDEAMHAWNRFNRYYHAGRKRLDDFLDPVVKTGIPEKAYQAAMSGTKEGASRLRAIKKSLSPAQWNLVVATTARKMGKAIPSAREGGEIAEDLLEFNPETFLSNMERLDVNARKALFTGSAYEGLERDLDDLMTVAQGIRAQERTLFNPSGTAQLLSQTVPATAAVVQPSSIPALATGMGAAYGIRRGMQSQPLIDYLMQAPTPLPASPLGQATRTLAAMRQ